MTITRLDGSIPVTLATPVEPGQGRYFRCLACGACGTAPAHRPECPLDERNREAAATDAPACFWCGARFYRWLNGRPVCAFCAGASGLAS